jgi:hypothetical protein
MNKGTEVAVQYKLPENWNNETAYSFDHLSELVEQVHNSAYSSAVKAINRFATIRNYIIGYYIVKVFRARITTVPGMDTSYKSAATFQFELSALLIWGLAA